MTCALIVFYLLGYATKANMPPIRTTQMEATLLLGSTSFVSVWAKRGVYPVIEACAG